MSAGTAAAPMEPEDGSASGFGRLERQLQRIDPIWVTVALFALALVVYVGSNPARGDIYDHFVWQADAFLQGRTEIAYPVTEGPYQNGYFQDVLPLPGTGLAQIPFPPLPALLLLPFVAMFGLGTNGAAVAAVLGAVNVALCWLMLLGVTPRRSAALLGTVFYGFGTVAWYAAMLGTTWFLAHVVASTFLFIAIAVAVRADPGMRPRLERGGHELARQFAAGLLLGVAFLARLTTIFGAPFFVFVGAGGSWSRRALSAGVGALIPVTLLLLYNVTTTGSLFQPAYEYLYEVEYRPRPELVNPDWGIEDPRYIPQNAAIMLAWPPLTPLLDDPACEGADVGVVGLVTDRDCSLLRPDPLGMSILLSSPAYLLMLPALLWWRRRIVAGAALAVLSIALIDLMHFSQGWVQFGYRFSNDFAPFATILVALGVARLGVGWISVGLVAASVAINAWGVYWGVTMGW